MFQLLEPWTTGAVCRGWKKWTSENRDALHVSCNGSGLWEKDASLSFQTRMRWRVRFLGGLGHRGSLSLCRREDVYLSVIHHLGPAEPPQLKGATGRTATCSGNTRRLTSTVLGQIFPETRPHSLCLTGWSVWVQRKILTGVITGIGVLFTTCSFSGSASSELNLSGGPLSSPAWSRSRQTPPTPHLQYGYRGTQT